MIKKRNKHGNTWNNEIYVFVNGSCALLAGPCLYNSSSMYHQASGLATKDYSYSSTTSWRAIRVMVAIPRTKFIYSLS